LIGSRKTIINKSNLRLFKKSNKRLGVNKSTEKDEDSSSPSQDYNVKVRPP